MGEIYHADGRARTPAPGAKRDHPESSNGYWYAYDDDASYGEALESIADVLEKHALPMLDAECGRGDG